MKESFHNDKIKPPTTVNPAMHEWGVNLLGFEVGLST